MCWSNTNWKRRGKITEFKAILIQQNILFFYFHFPLIIACDKECKKNGATIYNFSFKFKTRQRATDKTRVTKMVWQKTILFKTFFCTLPFSILKYSLHLPSFSRPSTQESRGTWLGQNQPGHLKKISQYIAHDSSTRLITVLTSKISRNILSVLHIMVHKKNGELTISYGRWKDRCWCLLQLCMIRVMQHFTLWVCGVAQVGVSLDAIWCDALSHHGLHALLFCNAGDTEPCQGITTGSKAV